MAGRRGGLEARNSRFEAGYGKSPGSGVLFDVRGSFVARLEGCVFRGPFRTLYSRGSGARIAFVNCRFVEMFPEHRMDLIRPPTHVVIAHSTFDYLREDRPTPLFVRSLTDINRSWAP